MRPTKIFLDAEFTGLHQVSSLISIGLAAEDGSVFYAEFTDYQVSQLQDWHRAHVLPQLSGNLRIGQPLTITDNLFIGGGSADVAYVLQRWLQRFGEKNSVHIWADVLAWDWVLFCQLYGGAFGIPEQVHYIPRDLSTYLECKHRDTDTEREQLGSVAVADYPHLKLAKHHALYDALLEKNIFEQIERELPF